MSVSFSFKVHGKNYTVDTAVTEGNEFEVKSGLGAYKVVFDTNEDPYDSVLAFLRGQGEYNALIADRRVLAFAASKMTLSGRMMLADAGPELRRMEGVMSMVDFLHKAGVTRSEAVAVLGGGTLNAAAGLACSLYRHGIPWTYFPTTSSAIGQGCIGGKVSADYANAKNLLGSFYPPRQVVINFNFLKTIDTREGVNGLGEMLKMCILGGPEMMDLYRRATLLGIPDGPEDWPRYYRLLRTTLAFKKTMVEADEFALDQRRVLNYGHMVACALEAASGFSLDHGQAVLMGIIADNESAVRQGLLKREECDDIKELARELLDKAAVSKVRRLQPEQVIACIQKDKKTLSDMVIMPMIKTAGESLFVKRNLDTNFKNELADIIKRELQA